MAITLGTVTFDAAHTTVKEQHEDVGGRDARRITVAGVIRGLSTSAAIEAQLDAILAAASEEAYTAELSLRTGRRLWVRRAKFDRQVAVGALAGSFILELEAKDPFEEATSVRSVPWTITASGATKAVTGGGNVYALPVITLVAAGNVVNPSLNDGSRMLTYWGTVGNGQTLTVNGPQGAVSLDGGDVTPYMTGVFPRIAPSGTTLTYTDDGSSSHTVQATIVVRDRWW